MNSNNVVSTFRSNSDTSPPWKMNLPRSLVPTLPRIDHANCTLSAITEVRRGEGRLMSSRASLTAAMIEAAITSVDA